MDAATFAQGIGRIESLLRQMEETADPTVRSTARELVQAVLTLHGAGLARIRSLLEGAGEQGRAILDACAGDELVSSLLLLHDLHPRDLETRVQLALERIRARGIDVELVNMTAASVRLRLASGAVAGLRPVLEHALFAAAPDLNGVEIVGIPDRPAERPGLFPLPLFGHGREHNAPISR
jgi:hypothetical protein